MKPIYKEKYPHLFEPLVVGKNQIEFKNRVFTAPMGCPLAQGTDGALNDFGVNLYGDFAKGGFGLVQAKVVIPMLENNGRSLSLANEDKFMSCHFLNQYAHLYGAKTGCEIYHQGAWMKPGAGRKIMSASALTMPGGIEVQAMTPDDMEEVADMYAEAAVLVKRSGFDLICLHFAHGWLMSSFLSPLFNKRTDAYGGSVENRMRFPRMVVERIRQKVGDALLIDVRLSGSEMTPGGIEIEEAIEQVKMLEDFIDMVHMTCGNRMNPASRPDIFPSHYLPAGHNAQYSAAVKKAGVKIPVGVVGGVHDPQLAENLLAEGKADYVLMARQANVDPNWVEKVRHGQEGDVRPCLRCNYCVDTGRRGALSKSITFDASATYDLKCAINPLYGQGAYKAKIPMPTEQKKVAVIGGGVAGMQAALTAAQRGHQVTLYEKSDKLGGQLFFADHMWFKAEVKKFREYLIRQVRQAGVTIQLETEATRAMIETADPDAVIVAVGAVPVVPPIPGVNNKNVMQAVDILGHEEQVGKKIVIIGGGSMGCETAIHLGGKDHETLVVEMGENIAGNAQFSQRMHIMRYMEQAGVQYQTGLRCVEITETGVWLENMQQEKRFIAADTVVLSVGNRALEDVRDQFKDVAFDVIHVGDCLKAADICTAVHTGFDAAMRL